MKHNMLGYLRRHWLFHGKVPRQLEDTSVWLPGAKASCRGRIKIFASVGSTAVKCTGAAG